MFEALIEQRPDKIAAVLFDLDDTLVDRRKSVARFAPAFAERFSCGLGEISSTALTQALVHADGGGYTTREERFSELLNTLPWRNCPDFGDFSAYWGAVFPGCAEPMPGLHSMLHELSSRGIRMGIVTNGASASQSGKLDTLGIRRYMGTIVMSEEVGLRKPDPRIFQLALDNLGIEPSAACYVGDHPANDVLGASDAGLTAVWLKGTHDWPEGCDEPRFQIDALSELVPLVCNELSLARQNG